MTLLIQHAIAALSVAASSPPLFITAALPLALFFSPLLLLVQCGGCGGAKKKKKKIVHAKRARVQNERKVILGQQRTAAEQHQQPVSNKEKQLPGHGHQQRKSARDADALPAVARNVEPKTDKQKQPKMAGTQKPVDNAKTAKNLQQVDNAKTAINAMHHKQPILPPKSFKIGEKEAAEAPTHQTTKSERVPASRWTEPVDKTKRPMSDDTVRVVGERDVFSEPMPTQQTSSTTPTTPSSTAASTAALSKR